jgi:hypothetical protein
VITSKCKYVIVIVHLTIQIVKYARNWSKKRRQQMEIDIQMDYTRIMHQILMNASRYVEMALKQEMKSEMMETQLPLMDVQLIDLQLKQAGCVY